MFSNPADYIVVGVVALVIYAMIRAIVIWGDKTWHEDD